MMSVMIRRRSSLGLLVLVLLLAPAHGWAHAVLVRSSPARRAALTRPPARVQLWFNERLEPAFAQLTVSDDKGRPIDDKDARVDATDSRQLSVGLPTLGPGAYTVKFRVLSVDGHVAEGTFGFTVRAAQ
jgi:copper resistance protein C